MNQKVEQKFRERFESYLEEKEYEKQLQEGATEGIVQVIISTLEMEFRTDELEYPLIGFEIYKNWASTYCMQVFPDVCQNQEMRKIMKQIQEIPYNQEVFESVVKFISSLENLSECSLENETYLRVLF